tara:strand:- start:95 stop:262 length:168 start_codon:yes stop_codon:yes gene_type:complete
MFCDVCKNNGLVQYRVANKKSKIWLFVCKDCWQDFSKTEGYIYGGTRKADRRDKK